MAMNAGCLPFGVRRSRHAEGRSLQAKSKPGYGCSPVEVARDGARPVFERRAASDRVAVVIERTHRIAGDTAARFDSIR